jgi:hypothetical protein
MTSYPENTPVFVLATPKLEFATMVELASGKQLGAYAFTSQEKAKKFMKIMREHEVLKRVNGVLPCTLKEWFNWQPTKKLPDLIIDIDPRKLRDKYDLIQADPAKYNITCITRDSINGTSYQVVVQPRDRTDANPDKNT